MCQVIRVIDMHVSGLLLVTSQDQICGGGGGLIVTSHIQITSQDQIRAGGDKWGETDPRGRYLWTVPKDTF